MDWRRIYSRKKITINYVASFPKYDTLKGQKGIKFHKQQKENGMATYKHLTDLLKICSVLPALAIMPAMAKTVDISDDTVIENQTNSNGSNQNAAGLTLSYGDKLSTNGANNVKFNNNSSVNSGGAMKALNGFVAGDSWTFTGNHSDKMSGGLYVKIPESYTGVDPENINRDVVFGKNTTFTGNSSKDLGGAMGIESAGNVTIGDNAKFTSNSTDADGGAIAIWTDSENGVKTPSTLTLGTSEFTGNTAANRGGAIANLNSDNNPTEFNNTVNIATSTFENNSAKNGGAIYNVGTMNVGGTFTGNKATSQGGAVWNSGTLNIADGSVFSENSNANGSAIYNDYKAGKLTIGDNVKFSGNLTGAAVYGGGEIKIGDGAEFTGNAGGIALSAFNKGSLEIGDNAVFTKNNSKKGGAAININVGADKFVMGNNAKFSENTSTQVGGALYIANNDATLGTGYTFENNTGAQGGALAYNGKNADAVLSLDNFTFDTNHAIGSTNKTAGGGALFISNGVTGTVDIKNSTFEKNDSTVAGGAILQEDGSTATINIDDSTFTQNQTGAEGGAVVSDATLVVKNSTFTGNKTTGTKVVEAGKPVLDANGGGGAIFLYDESNTTISGSTFTGNESGTYGGAIATRMGADSAVSSLTLSNSVFESNHAGANGGAVYNTVKTTIGNGMSFTDNNAHNGGAIWNDRDAILSFVNTEQIKFEKNIAGNAGGAIYNSGVIDKISNVLFKENEGYLAGAINNSNLIGENQGGYIGEISNSQFIGNKGGTSMGGAIRNQGQIAKITDVLFSGNTAGNGGALHNGTWGSLVDSVTNVDFIGNVATGGVGQGGAIVNAGKIALIDGSNFSDNRADVKGGAIANVAPSDGDGTAIATITLKDTNFTGNIADEMGGAIYNHERGEIVLNGKNTFSGNMAGDVANDIHNDGKFSIASGTTTLGGGITGDGTLTIADGATLNIGTTVVEQASIDIQGALQTILTDSENFGSLAAKDITTSGNGVLQLIINGVGEYDIFGETPYDDVNIKHAGVYDVTQNDTGAFVVSEKAVADIAADTGLTTNSANAVNVLLKSEDDVLNTISLMAQQDLVAGNTGNAEKELAKLNPDDKPVAQSVASSVQNQVMSLAAGRMSGASVGRSGGDLTSADYGLWVQGLYNHSKYNGKFSGDTWGISVGADTLIDGKYTLGIGYAYNDTDVDSNSRDTTIESNSLFLYGQYKPNEWYVNAALNYTMANYDESADPYGFKRNAEYDVDSFGGQIMTGYDFASGFTPEVGMRYLHISQDAYQSALGTVDALDTDYLTGVAGVKYAFEIESASELKFRPELRAAATYDFMSDAAVATVNAPGNVAYVIDADRLSRFGGEFGIGLTAQYRGLDVSLNYELDLHEDYTSQTGMLKFRYDF